MIKRGIFLLIGVGIGGFIIGVMTSMAFSSVMLGPRDRDITPSASSSTIAAAVDSSLMEGYHTR
jgi:hypothetical protein